VAQVARLALPLADRLVGELEGGVPVGQRGVAVEAGLLLEALLGAARGRGGRQGGGAGGQGQQAGLGVVGIGVAPFGRALTPPAG
jgi:hypothetical protein